MIDINPVNAVTIALIAILSWALVKFGANALGLNFAWLN